METRTNIASIRDDIQLSSYLVHVLDDTSHRLPSFCLLSKPNVHDSISDKIVFIDYDSTLKLDLMRIIQQREKSLIHEEYSACNIKRLRIAENISDTDEHKLTLTQCFSRGFLLQRSIVRNERTPIFLKLLGKFVNQNTKNTRRG